MVPLRIAIIPKMEQSIAGYYFYRFASFIRALMRKYLCDERVIQFLD